MTDTKDKLKEDILKLEEKRETFHQDYPTSYKEIAKRYGYSTQHIFNIRNKLIEKGEIEENSKPVNLNR